MSKKVLLVGGMATVLAIAGGLALAQPGGFGSGGYGPHGMGGDERGGMERGGMGPGMMRHMGRGQGGGMREGMDHGGRGPGGGMGRGMNGSGMGHGPGLGNFDPKQIDALKTELGITAAQEPAWTKYAKALQDTATARQQRRESVDRDAVHKLSPEDRSTFRSQMREQAQKESEALKVAADELLATLDGAQKSKAEDNLPDLAFGPRPMYGAADGGHHRGRR